MATVCPAWRVGPGRAAAPSVAAACVALVRRAAFAPCLIAAAHRLFPRRGKEHDACPFLLVS